MRSHQVFLLSPANCSGKRAGFLMREGASFDLAVRLRTTGASIGAVFSFMSGLYFRGKVAYAAAFGNAPEGCAGAYVIVPGQGLLPPDHLIDLAGLSAIAKVPVDPEEPRYVDPLRRDAGLLHRRLGADAAVILLGSIATTKYLEPLGAVIAGRLRYPEEFVGRGDMSRGSLMLKCAAAGRELAYTVAAPLVVADFNHSATPSPGRRPSRGTRESSSRRAKSRS